MDTEMLWGENMIHADKKTINFTVIGGAVGQGRPKFSTFNGKTFAYDPAKSRNEKALYRYVAQQAMQEQGLAPFPSSMPISVVIKSYRDIPKSKPKWFKEAALRGLVVPVTKPDCDNVCKLILDAVTETCFMDDKCVYKLEYESFYSDVPRAEVSVTGYFVDFDQVKRELNRLKNLEESPIDKI